MIAVHSLSTLNPNIWREACTRNNPSAPFFSRSWHKTWFGIFGKNLTPWIVVSETIVIPLVHEESILTFSGGREICDYMDAIGKDNKKFQAWEETLSYAAAHGIKQLILPNIPETSQSLNFFRSLKDKVLIAEEDSTPIVALPSSWGSYLLSLGRHARHELGRKLKKFERENPETVVVEQQDLEKGIETLFHLMDKDPQKNNFLTPTIREFFQKIVASYSTHTQVLQLEVNKMTVASILTFIFDNTAYLYNSGFDEEHFSGAGFYLKVKAIEHAISHGYRTYNFLQGKERYKYELGGKDFLVYTVTVDLAKM